MKKEIIVKYIVDVEENSKPEFLEEAAIALTKFGRDTTDLEFVYDESADIFYSVEDCTFSIDGSPAKNIDTADEEFFTEERLEIFNKKHF